MASSPKSMMAERQETRYSHIEQDGDFEGVDCVHEGLYHDVRNLRNLLRWSLLTNSIFAVAVIGLGASMYLQNSKSTLAVYDNEILSSQVLEDQYGVSAKIPTTYQFFQDGFDDDDFTKGDPYWANLFPKGNGVVFLSDEVVESYRLPPAVRQPQRGNHSVYEIAGFHSLHCLSGVRATISRLLRAQETSIPYIMDHSTWNHIKHCIGDARQALLCHFDETLLIGHDLEHPGKDQTKLCKDLGPITKWAEDHYTPLD